MYTRLLATALAFFTIFSALLVNGAQNSFAARDSEFENGEFGAQWISDSSALDETRGVYALAKDFELDSVTSEFRILVSADPRCKIFVNGKCVGIAPACGAPSRWYFDEIDIAQFLKSGRNSIRAVVWNFGAKRPYSQMSLGTSAFILRGKGGSERALNTGKEWKSKKLEAYDIVWEGFFGQTGAGEKFDSRGNSSSFLSEEISFENAWRSCAVLRDGRTEATRYGISGHRLSPRDIPLLKSGEIPSPRIVRSTTPLAPKSLGQGRAIKIAPNKTEKILLDFSRLENAFPTLTLSGGKDAEIKIRYAENLYEKNGTKGDRRDVKNKEMLRARYDIYISNGEAKQKYTPLDFRTFWYVELLISTKSEELVVEDFSAKSVGYPLESRAIFDAFHDEISGAEFAKIRKTAFRTAQLCATDTYYDCPYYERLQYVGDTRVQTYVSLYECGDARLMRKAILMFDLSRDASGLTQCAYPSRVNQIIPPFSLVWISIVHDYLRYAGEPAFVEERLAGVEAVLSWFESKLQDGILKPNLPYWNFMDWVDSWVLGVPPSGAESGSGVESLLLSISLDDASQLFSRFGKSERATHYKALSEEIKKAVFGKCWNAEKKMLRDAEGLESYSQHAQILGVLSGAIPEAQQKDALLSALKSTRGKYLGKCRTPEQLPKKSSLKDGECVADTTMYFKFYLSRALKKAGLGELYINTLSPWREMLDLNCSTFPETPDPSRSECHAWSASPSCDFFSVVCGIEPLSEGFETVRVAPVNLSGFREIRAKTPHKKGDIEFYFERKIDEKNGIIGKYKIVLPHGVKGIFETREKSAPLKSGENTFEVVLEKPQSPAIP